MKYIFCHIAWACILICYVQRCIANPNWIKYPVGMTIMFAVMAGGMAVTLIIVSNVNNLLTLHGWVPR